MLSDIVMHLAYTVTGAFSRV